MNIIMYGDFGMDLDDEFAAVMLKHLINTQNVNVLAVIANLCPAIERAAIIKGTLNELGLENIPVGVGTEVVPLKQYKYEKDIPYATRAGLLNGKELAVNALQKAEDNSVTLVLNSGLTDVTELLTEHQELFTRKVKSVSIMGGVQTLNDEVHLTGHYIQPDSANNITFDWPSGVWLFAKLQDLGIPMTIVTRNAAYAAQVKFSIYDKMEETGNPIGKCLKSRQEPALEKLWIAANAAPDDLKVRGTLPPDRDRQWFLDVFCGGKDPGEVESIWPYTAAFNLYDPMNLLFSIDSIVNEFANVTKVNVKGTEHKVIGVSSKNHGIKNIDNMISLMESMILNSLKG